MELGRVIFWRLLLSRYGCKLMGTRKTEGVLSGRLHGFDLPFEGWAWSSLVGCRGSCKPRLCSPWPRATDIVSWLGTLQMLQADPGDVSCKT